MTNMRDGVDFQLEQHIDLDVRPCLVGMNKLRMRQRPEVDRLLTDIKAD